MIRRVLQLRGVRPYSTSACKSSIAKTGIIYLSKSLCIFENLAYEEWLFHNHSLAEKGEALLLWSNAPAVVIGKFQNPWMEADVKFCESKGINIARRHSGGGAVYHDRGNLNISFFTSQQRHCRPRNLNLLANFLNSSLDTTLITPTLRDDLIFRDTECKISGTAARIAHAKAYHHLTLLLDVDLGILKKSLNSNLKAKIITSATRSTPAKCVGYLNQKFPILQMHELIDIVSRAFSSNLSDGNVELVEWSPSEGLEEERDSLPGLYEIYRQLKCREWIFGRTPKFELDILDSRRMEESPDEDIVLVEH